MANELCFHGVHAIHRKNLYQAGSRLVNLSFRHYKKRVQYEAFYVFGQNYNIKRVYLYICC